jgi:hypothetical protein
MMGRRVIADKWTKTQWRDWALISLTGQSGFTLLFWSIGGASIRECLLASVIICPFYYNQVSPKYESEGLSQSRV